MTKNSPAGITGRDGYIMAKALAYAITTIDNLPQHQQEWSDREDMLAILTAMCPCPKVRAHFFSYATGHTGLKPAIADTGSKS